MPRLAATCWLLLTVITLSRLSAQLITQTPDNRYTGAGSCSSSSCHGGVQPRNTSSVLQNEYSTWALQDRHAKAFRVLAGDQSRRIGRILGVEPEKSARCLTCHALDVPPDEKARSFDVTDGVSCENCHGAASNWLGPHTTQKWDYAKSVRAGMYDTRDLIKRSEKCLSCHLGDANRAVTHEMLAAGHPDLYFELDSFSAVEPRHWKEPAANDPGIRVRTLAVGQAVQLRENMRRIARDARRAWPEYGDLDCFSCHHSLTNSKDSWRQERGFAGRKPGSPPWNGSRFAVLRVIAAQLDSNESQQLAAEVSRVNALVSDIHADSAQIAASADAAANAADRVARRLTGTPIDSASSLQLMHAIAADADRIAAQGERSAEQAAMVLDALYLAYSNEGQSSGGAQLKSAIGGLFPLLENPSSYQPGPFARQMRNVAAALPR